MYLSVNTRAKFSEVLSNDERWSLLCFIYPDYQIRLLRIFYASQGVFSCRFSFFFTMKIETIVIGRKMQLLIQREEGAFSFSFIQPSLCNRIPLTPCTRVMSSSSMIFVTLIVLCFGVIVLFRRCFLRFHAMK